MNTMQMTASRMVNRVFIIDPPIPYGLLFRDSAEFALCLRQQIDKKRCHSGDTPARHSHICCRAETMQDSAVTHDHATNDLWNGTEHVLLDEVDAEQGRFK